MAADIHVAGRAARNQFFDGSFKENKKLSRVLSPAAPGSRRLHPPLCSLTRCNSRATGTPLRAHVEKDASWRGRGGRVQKGPLPASPLRLRRHRRHPLQHKPQETLAHDPLLVTRCNLKSNWCPEQWVPRERVRVRGVLIGRWPRLTASRGYVNVSLRVGTALDGMPFDTRCGFIVNEV
jgi:hypothetical protein